MNPFNASIEYWKSRIANIAGANYSFSVIRPPYAVGDNTGTVVATGLSMFVEPAGPNWAQDKIPDAEFYTVCGDHSQFRSGDILDSGADIPLVTVFSDADSQEFLAIKTDKPCHIEDMGSPLFTGLHFDYMNSTSAGPDEYQELTAQNNPVRRAILYGISGITEGMKFWDDSSGWVWEVSKVDYKFSLCVLFLENSNRV